MNKKTFYLSIAIFICILTFLTNLPDYDLWARLAVGSIFLQTGHVLKHDIFSYLPTNNLWIDHEWGSGVVFFFLTKHFGDLGLFFLKAIILFAIFLLVFKIIKLQNDKYSPGAFYFIFFGFSILPGIANLIRCQMFTYLFFTLWIYALEKIKRGDPKIFWVFPVSMLFWVNLHGGFLAGIGLVIIYAAGELLNRNKYDIYIGILALIIPVTLVNPYGFELWRYMAHAAFMPRDYISEWGPLSFSGPFHVIAGIKIHILAGFVIFALLTIFAGIKLLRQKEKKDWTRILLVTALLYLGVRHQRHAMFFVLAIPGLFYHHYINLFEPLRIFIKNTFNEKSYQIWTKTNDYAGYTVLAVILIYVAPHLSGNIIVNPALYPVGSFEFVKQNNLSGNLATSYNWGSYALWKLYPQCKVLIDGRYEEVYSGEAYDLAIKLSEHEEDWQAILGKYKTDILILQKSKYSPEDISNLADWRPVYQDACSVLLLPKDGIKPFYIYPDYENPVFFKEDLSRNIGF